MDDLAWLAERFETQRTRLKAVAYRMLGSLADAEDAVQEAWLRLSRSDPADIANLNAWLTTVVGRVSLNMLQARKSRSEELTDAHLPDPVVSLVEPVDPEHQTVLAESVGLALLVVLETLAPGERLAFVLHDMFGMSFEEIAPIVERSPAAARQLASRARRKVRTSAVPDTDLARQRKVADAFLAAAHGGDFEALLAVLDPDVVIRVDGGTRPPRALRVVRGARAVAEGALRFARLAPLARAVLVNGAPGFMTRHPDGRPLAVAGLTIRNGRIVEINVLSDVERLQKLDLPGLADLQPVQQTVAADRSDRR